MMYSIIGILAIILHLIMNYEYVLGVDRSVEKGLKSYLVVVLVYYVTDTVWGVLYDAKLMLPLYLDTVMYFLTMVVSTIFWCRYVISCFDRNAKSGTALMVMGNLFCLFEVVILAVNVFYPVYFMFDGEKVYHPLFFRYISVALQVLLYVLTALRTFSESGARDRRRPLIISLVCLVMSVAVVIQVMNSLYPLYTIGLIISTCLLRLFVQEDERNEYRKQLSQNENMLRESNEILENTGYGIWKIQLKPDGRHTMTANDKLKEIFGIRGMDLSPEQMYRFYHERLMEDVGTIESEDYRLMEDGVRMTRVMSWNHPEKGRIYIHAGGSSYTTHAGEKTISGYCGDVTQQRKHEIRSGLIINTLARSYEFLHYIKMASRTFITTSNNLYADSDPDSEHDALSAISFACEQRISPEFRRDMVQFSDLSTIDERMKHRSMMINQFKDMKGVWHEWSYVVADRNEDGTIRHLIWAIRKIEDEKQAEFRKQQIIEDNIAANRAKTMFLQNMSHEIRTPLNTMFGFAQLLGMPDGTWSDEEKEQYNKYIFNSYNMLDMLIGDIIDIADSEHGNYRIELSEVSVNSVCRDAIVSVEYRKPAGVNLYFTSEVPDTYTVVSDGKRIQQVLINYLTNACKHTSEGEIHLHCSASENPGRLTFSVADTGTGVPAEKADIIFKRFAKLNQFVQGSGLGLNICLMIAEKLGGKVYLDTGYTGGARFVFELEDTSNNSK